MEKVPRIVLYFFSGTGNSRKVATWMQEKTAAEGVQTEVVNLSGLEDRRNIPHPGEAVVGFCSPTHGFNFPPVMFHFILRFPRTKKGKAFVMNTRAGMKMGKLFLPGLSGMALYLSALILRLKGYRIIGMRPIDLPSNWISIHPGMRQKVVDSIHRRRKKDVIDFTGKMLEGKRVWRGLRGLIPDLLITPIGILYYFIGRFVLAKTFVASKDCTRCDLCVKQCPVEAIKIVDGRCFWTMSCESCMRCMNSCPHRAIETAHGFIIGFSFLVYSGVLVWLNKLAGVENWLEQTLGASIGHQLAVLFNWGIYLLLLLPFYRLMHYLLRFRFFERLIIRSSLTSFGFWRRYKSSKE